MKKLHRRNFLKISATGAAGLFVTSRLSGHSLMNKKQVPRKDEFIYRTLGKTGLKLPIVSMGVMRADNPKLVKAALDAGMKHLDTAFVYQNGQNEKMLGEVLQEYERDSYTIATKIYMPQDKETNLFTDEATTEKFLEQLNTSLERLKLDYVDILYLHSTKNREATLHEPMLEGLRKAKEQGKTRFVGVSTHRNEPEVIQAAIDSEFYDIVLTAYNFQQKNLVDVKSAIKKASDAGIGVVVMKTMAGGFLDKERTKPVNATAALKWALADENAHTSIPGFTSYDELEECLSVVKKLKLNRKEKKFLQNNDSGSLYCPGCDECIDKCRKKLPIPDLMRAYMYAYGYKDLALSRQLLDSLDVPKNVCSDCGICTTSCAKNFDIRAKIMDINRLRSVPNDFLS